MSAPFELSKTRRNIQMTDIARMAGVSTSTVSRALSGSTLIPQTTRDRIRELARTLNYQVNVGAANLRKRDIKTIGVVILGESAQVISDPFLLSVLGSIADALDARGMSLILTRLRGETLGSSTTMFDNGQVAGLIIIGQLTLHEGLNSLARQVPMVVWGANLPDATYCVVGGDNAAGGFLATQHLIEQGCKRIAFFGDTSHPEAGQRFLGYQRAMNNAGYAIDERLVQPFLFGDIRIRETIDRWLNQHIDIDAIFATSDVTAISLMGALSERGVAVPAQVKIVGYDDIFLAAHVHPSLTTIRQPTEQAGHALVDLLFEVIQGQPRRVLTLPTELVLRDSTVCA
jgi:DNA-binding LacI/PurR family transcriptional regulator